MKLEGRWSLCLHLVLLDSKLLPVTDMQPKGTLHVISTVNICVCCAVPICIPVHVQFSDYIFLVQCICIL